MELLSATPLDAADVPSARRLLGDAASNRTLFCILGGTVSLIFNDLAPGARSDELVDPVAVAT